MCNTVASQLVRDNLPRFTMVIFKQSFEKVNGGRAVPSGLQKYINNFTVQVMLFTLDLYEDFVYVKCITETPMFSSQFSGIHRSKLVAP